MDQELDYDEEWDYEQTVRDQVKITNTLEIKGRIKLASINQEERVWKIQRKLESEKKESTKMSKIQILETELKISQKNTNDQITQNQLLRDENTELKEKISRMEMLYEKRKIEIYVALDAFLLDPNASYDEFFDSLKFR